MATRIGFIGVNAGLEYRPIDEIAISTNLFFNDIDNLIDTQRRPVCMDGLEPPECVLPGELNEFAYTNVARARTGGVEALVHFAPIAALKPSFTQLGAKRLAAVLVGAQFAAASLLVIAVTVTTLQNAKLVRTGLGAVTDPLVLVQNQSSVTKVDSATLRAELERLPGVTGVTEAANLPWQRLVAISYVADSPEATAAREYREALVRAHQEDTVRTRCYSGKPLRALKNPYIAEWETDPSRIKRFPEQLVLSRKGALIGEPVAVIDGVPTENAQGDAMIDIVLDAVDGTLRSIPQHNRRNAETVGEAIRRSVRAAVNEAWGKKPICKVLVNVVDSGK